MGAPARAFPTRIVIAMAPSARKLREQIVYWTSLALVATRVVALTIALLRSRWGLALRAIRDNELAARSSGVEVERAKWLVYVFAASGDGAWWAR